MNVSLYPSFSNYRTSQHSVHVSQGRQHSAFTSATRVITHEPIHVRLPGQNCLYSGGDGKGQDTYIEYTDYSTTEDPVVHITGNSSSGPYEETVHINEIDPNNATYPELCALMRHLQKIGEYHPSQTVWDAIPLDVDRGNYSQRQNFMQAIQNCIRQNKQYNAGMAQTGVELLELYEKFMAEQEHKLKVSSSNEYVDSLIDYAGRKKVDII